MIFAEHQFVLAFVDHQFCWHAIFHLAAFWLINFRADFRMASGSSLGRKSRMNQDRLNLLKENRLLVLQILFCFKIVFPPLINDQYSIVSNLGPGVLLWAGSSYEVGCETQTASGQWSESFWSPIFLKTWQINQWRGNDLCFQLKTPIKQFCFSKEIQGI